MNAKSGFLIGLGLLILGAGSLASAQTAKSPDSEAVVSSIWISSAGAPYRDSLKLDQLTEDLASLPFKEVLVQVRTSGDAYYNSKLVPKAPGVAADFDPLARLLTKLGEKKNSPRLVAWLDPYHAGNLKDKTALADSHVLKAHPEWLSVRADGSKTDPEGNYYLELGLPAVQSHLEAVIAELVTQYPLQAIYLDPMSDPPGDGTWGFHPEVLKLWQEQGGAASPKPADPEWIAFRAELVSKALGGLVSAARQAKPGIKVYIGAHTYGTAPATAADFTQTRVWQQTHQPWPAWLGNRETCDRIYLKDFKPEGTAAEDFDRWMNLALDLAKSSGMPVVVGVEGALNDSVDGLAQLRRAAAAGGQGLALSDYAHPVRDMAARDLFMTAIGRTVFSPEYLKGLALARQAVPPGEPKPEPAPEPSPAATPIPTPAVARAAKPAELAKTKPTPEPSEGQFSPAESPEAIPTPEVPKPAGEQTPKAKGETFELPPPPTEEMETPIKIQPEIVKGKIIPMEDKPTTKSRIAEIPSLKAMDELAGKEKPIAETAPPVEEPKTKPAPVEIPTRRQMLADLLKDPMFQRSREWSLIRPDKQYEDTLRKTYKNIF